MAGDAHKGNPNAELLILEFSDFQCPSCQQHALNTGPVLDDKFVATGQVYWVFENLPLAMHPNAPAAAAAVDCAGGQGRFWEMARLLFSGSATWSEGDPDQAIIALAQDADLSPAHSSPTTSSGSSSRRCRDRPTRRTESPGVDCGQPH